MKFKVLNSKGQPIVLNSREEAMAQLLQNQANALKNALGFEVQITTLTQIIKKHSDQKFFEVAPADYLPVVVGEGAWASNLEFFRQYSLGDDFATGVLNDGGPDGKLAGADVGIDSLNQKVINWGKQINWTLPQIFQAQRSGNWDIIAGKEQARKKNWDLGIQKLAFLGLSGSTSVLGLLNQSGVTTNTADLTLALSAMTPEDLAGFCAVVLDRYRTNCARTAWPTHFIIPESDYLGLATPSNPAFPVKSKLQILEETLKVMTKNPNFKILPLAYADQAYSGLGYQIYTLLNYDETSLRMTIPVDYTSTLANTLNGFQFQNVAYGQFAGVQLLRPSELLYFRF